ncbi:MAG TPA: hypothetical protein VN253_16950 [Kofleriaceae bacterium]|nr:hypothetical protein [Kofleriaceae bacterium]
MMNDLPRAMIHPAGDRLLLITTDSDQENQAAVVSALYNAGISPARISDRVITLEYARGLREKKVIAALASMLRTAGFQPGLPGRGRRTWRPL